ncbi:MAG: alanyl-tRNA editing protein [Tateyamaria sp.]|nr:alanyl-tRNA editing protein [Tateyamaria sp.]MDG2057681.1 alanyl-tRNA editing protein [Tateyamaria sp.]
MTEKLFLTDAYARDVTADVVAHTAEGGIVLDRSVFYPTGGGQPGDSGSIAWAGGAMSIATTIKGEGDQIVLIPAEPNALPPVGVAVDVSLDWDRRYAHMRMHTALHLLSVVIPYGVTGGSIGAQRGRLDFNMEDAPDDREAIEDTLNSHVSADMWVSEEWITEAELDANPGIVKTLSVKPPRGAGRIRLVRVGQGSGTVDLQPCGGTHVARTGEIGALRLGKIEKKGRMNRRVYLHFDS